jgi:hypothetical protein
MPLAYAFKNAAEAARLAPNALEREFSLAIARFTGGPYSHVEAWIWGPITQAVCYSAREPRGTSIEVLDLSNTALWTIVQVVTTREEDQQLLGYAKGGQGRPYDAFGILGIGSDSNLHVEWDRFCSEECFAMGRDVVSGLKGVFLPAIPRWKVAPSGLVRGGFGMFELLKSV